MTRTSRLSHVRCLSVAFGILLAATHAHAQSVNDPSLVVETVASGLSLPTTMAFIANDDFLVLEQHTGRVRRVTGGVLQLDPVLDLPVTGGVDNGLLGIALDPDFVNDRELYLYYSEATVDGGTPVAIRVARYTWNGSLLVDPLIVVDLPYDGHNEVGGILGFGRDDKLYTLVGAQERMGKLQNEPSGADPDHTGVILRTNTDGSAVPDNPFFGATGTLSAMSRYFAYGIRNSFGFTFDPLTGALWDTENGQDTYDEINRIDAGFDSGWEKIQGPDARSPQNVGDLWIAPGAHYGDPVFSWSRPVGVTSIAFLPNPKLGCGRLHDVLVGDSNCGAVRHFVPNAARNGFSFTSPALSDLVADNNAGMCALEQTELAFGTGFGVVSDLKTGPDGNLYVVDLIHGIVRRIRPALPALADADGDGVDDSCDCNAADSGSYSTTVEVPRVRVSNAVPTTLGWDAQAAAAGSGVTYSVVTGSLASLHAGGSFAGACTLGTSSSDARIVDARTDPAPGEAYFYLVRASNGCGAGTFGDASVSPDPRDVIDSALPAPCATVAMSKWQPVLMQERPSPGSPGGPTNGGRNGSYHLRVLPVPDGCSAWSYVGHGLADTGAVVGNLECANTLGHRAILWDASGSHILETLGGTSSYAFGISRDGSKVLGAADTGEIASDGRFVTPPVIWTNGTIVELATLGGTYGGAVDIDQRESVVGACESAEIDPRVHRERVRACLWKRGASPIDLGDLGGPDAEALDVNKRGWVVGWATNTTPNPSADGFDHIAFLHDGSTMSALGTLGGEWSEAYASNESGEVVGQSETDIDHGGSFRELHAFAWRHGVMRDLGTLGGGYALASDINARGDIVGAAVAPPPPGQRASVVATLWRGDTIQDLNSLVADLDGWSLQAATAIDETGRILVQAYRAGIRIGILEPRDQ